MKDKSFMHQTSIILFYLFTKLYRLFFFFSGQQFVQNEENTGL